MGLWFLKGALEVVDRPLRSVFVTSRQAEAFLATAATVLNPHPLGRLLDRVALQRGERGLQALAVHQLELARQGRGTDALAALEGLELDSAFRLTNTRRAGQSVPSAAADEQRIGRRPSSLSTSPARSQG